MKTFRVMASFVSYCEVLIEAEDEDQAYEKAKDMVGGAFDAHGYGDWNIDEVTEL
jgi:hypothetical protein